METAHPILENPLLLAAILLFLAILPLALRQKKKTALDRAVERFEKEELKIATKVKPEKPLPKKEASTPSEDRPLDYLLDDQLMPSDFPVTGGIPPFRDPNAIDNESKGGNAKGEVIISYNRPSDPPQTPRKKSKLVKQEISIAPGRNRETAKKASSGLAKAKTEEARTIGQKSSAQKKTPDPLVNDSPATESDDNWVEAEIPGLIMDPLPVPEASENIPTFKASPKPEDPLQAEKSLKEKQSSKVKNLTSHSEEKKSPKPQNQAEIEGDLPDIAIEISDSGMKQVEFNAPVVSHKKTTDKGNELKAAPDKTRAKPFFLDLKFLDREEKETVPSVSRGNVPTDRVENVIDRLNTLQTELEQQLVSISGPLTTQDDLTSESQERDRTRESLSRSERSISDPTGNTQISLEDLDSFLFTARQRKNKE